MRAGEEPIDLMHQGRARVIGAWLVGETIVDPGPSSCLERLLEAIGEQSPRVIALTHIHLDHAGATGSLLERFPDAEVWVHERGAPHLVDPSRLLASATRLYGDQMQRLWGEVLAVPEQRIRVLRGGERIGPFRVAYTPGHASHHVSYLHEPSGRAFTGDVAGVRIGEGPVLAPTPPPDIDLAAWSASLDAIEAWQPGSLAVTHFGAVSDVPGHLAQLRGRLERLREMGRELDERGFTEAMAAELEASCSPELAATYARAMPPAQSFHGLRRYLDRLDADKTRL
jgi:glyoxylase-like metal-dependent hydrolase (beta-lactamase superfamily II)